MSLPRDAGAAAAIVVVGATGAVGRELFSVLQQRGHGARWRAVASPSSVGETWRVGDSIVTVEALRDGLFRPGTLVFLATDAELSRRLAAAALARGARVVDNSSAFRADPAVPLIVPEVNGATLRADAPPLLANPNCSTILLLVTLEPLRRTFGIRHVTVATYQAVSGAGQAGMQELLAATRAALDGEPFAGKVFPAGAAFNVFPHESAVDGATGANEEERKIVAESRRIWGEPAAAIEPSCVRVPVLRAHSQSVVVELAAPASLAQVRSALRGAPGIALREDDAAPPTPQLASGRDEVLVGRVRPSLADVGDGARHRRFHLWLCGDQLRKGAALNAVQIAERAGWL